MGAWGPGNFENDDALDFLAEVDGPSVPEAVFKSLPGAGEGEVDATDACRVLAAAEIVAAMMGRPSVDCPPEVPPRLEEYGAPTGELIELARQGVSRVLFDSELLDLWAESKSREDWNVVITDLIQRLNPEIPVKKRGDRETAPVKSNAICHFCNDTVGTDPSLLLTVKVAGDGANGGMEMMMECHLKCFNGKLHPRRLLQNWVHDPDDPALQAAVDRILNMDPDWPKLEI
jgi:hypothetical protein